MRREQHFRMSRLEAVELLRRAPYVHLATSRSDGAPVLRVVHGVVHHDHLYFHGAPAGEKMDALGREAVLSHEEVVAEVPSWFTDGERACPATTYYESVQVHAVLEEESDPAQKAMALQLLMEKFQPEGRHVPITHEHPLYRKAVEGILIVKLSLERLDGKSKLGQNKRPDELGHILEQLWRRGRDGDVRAIERIRRANPAAPAPSFLRGPDGVTLRCAVDERHLDEVVQLLRGSYWNLDTDDDTIRRAHLQATAWVGALDESGRPVASARAVSDGAKHGWIYDVIVDERWRGRGVGQALMRLLVDHPALRSTRAVHLQTRDAESLYARFGFRLETDPAWRKKMIRLA